MARLGKREREHKRDLIKGNLANMGAARLELKIAKAYGPCAIETTRVAAKVGTMSAYVGKSEGRNGRPVSMTKQRWGQS